MTDQFNSPISNRTASPHLIKNSAVSPNHYDAEFYRRKSDRLEQQVIVLSEQLNKVSLRLRRAEDFQIKYDLLFKQKNELAGDLIKSQKQIYDLQSKQEQLNLLLKQKASRSDQNNYQKLSILSDLEAWKQRCLEAEERAKMTAIEEQNKATEKLQRELAKIKRNFAEAEQEYKYQISRLTKQVQQKTGSENLTVEKNEKIKKEKDNQIIRLEKVIQKNREELLETIEQKNKEIERVKNKFQQIFNDEISHLQANMSNQDSRFNLQLEGLKSIIQMKSEEISVLQNELKITLEHNTKQRDELNYQISLLKDKIYQRQRQNEEELFNMKQRLTKLHSVDIQSINIRYEELIDSLKKQRQQLQKLMKQKDNKVEYDRKEFERGRNDLINTIKDRQKKIQQLSEKNSHSGSTSSNQINNLHQSLSKLQTEKETLTNQYQSNINFLNQQITKLINSNELKNNEIKQLHQQIALLKKQHFENGKNLQNKWKNERKERQAQRQKQRDMREKIEEQYREKEKNWRNKERQLEREVQKQRRQKNKTLVNLEQLQKDIERLTKQKNTIDENYKKQLNKSQLTIISSGSSKRELTNEVEKQKADMEALKRLQVEQIRKKFELQITRLSNNNERLQTELANRNIAYENLEEELKKISNQNKNMQKINKQKMADYHKKMATLNSEILLTQNLYQSFIQAKSKVKRVEE